MYGGEFKGAVDYARDASHDNTLQISQASIIRSIMVNLIGSGKNA